MNFDFNNRPVDIHLIENENKIRAKMGEYRLDAIEEIEIERYTDRYNNQSASNNKVLEMLVDEIFPAELGGFDDEERLENTVTEDDVELAPLDEDEVVEEESEENDDVSSDEKKHDEPVL